MSNQIKCYLKSLENTNERYELYNDKKTIIGRFQESLIKIDNPFCSRKQIEICPNFEKYEILVKNIGKTTSGVNGCKFLPDEKIILKHNDIIEIVFEKLLFTINFDPTPQKLSVNSNKHNNNKTDLNEEIIECTESKKPKIGIQIQKHSINDSESTESKKPKIDLNNSIESPNKKGTGTWVSIGNGKLLIFTSNGINSSSKIASYDLDGTLITTLKGNVFPKDYNDWKLAYSNINSKLESLTKNGYKIVIFTNQAGISTGKTKVKPFKKKIEDILMKLNVPVQVFISAGEGMYRKPLIGMWTDLVENRNSKKNIDMDHSFFCGDAAGRIKTSKRKKDFSSSDRLFALNINLNFFTPEEHFSNGSPEPYDLPNFRPKSLQIKKPLLNPSTETLTKSEQELIVMVGYPGSGKSTFSKKHFSSSNYDIVSQDICGSLSTCFRLAENALKNGKSVCVDNTNPDPESRHRWINLAKSYTIPIRCFILDVTMDHAIHNIKFRQLTDATHVRINQMILNVFKSKFKEPVPEEGFNSIVKVNFIPHFENAQDANLYFMYLT